MYEPEFELLFCRYRGFDARRVAVEAAIRQAEAVPDDDIQSDKLDAAVAQIIHDSAMAVPVLDRENISFDQGERHIQRQDGFGRAVQGRVSVHYFHVPFAGNPDIFDIQPNQNDLNPPRGEVRGSALVVSVEGTDDPDQLKRQLEEVLASAQRYLNWHSDFWKDFEQEVGRAVRGKLSERLQHRGKSEATASGLEKFGFKPRGGR